jgi:hypothetical protein
MMSPCSGLLDNIPLIILTDHSYHYIFTATYAMASLQALKMGVFKKGVEVFAEPGASACPAHSLRFVVWKVLERVALRP